jgi:hypothetical protein
MSPHEKKCIDKFDLEDYRTKFVGSAYKSSNFRLGLENADQLGFELLNKSGHSKTGVLTLYSEGRITGEYFVKQYFTDNSVPSGEEGYRHPSVVSDPELRTSKILRGNPIKSKKIPCIHGQTDNDHILVFERNPYPSLRTLLLDKVNSDEDNSEKERIELIYYGLKEAALFDGLLQANSSSFAFCEGNDFYSPDNVANRFRGYLLNAIKHSLIEQGTSVPSNNYELLLALSEENSPLGSVNLFEISSRLAKSSSQIHIQDLVLQHGDMRTKHILYDQRGNGTQIVDLEQVGYHPRGMSLANLMSDENGISSVPENNFGDAVACFLAYENAGKITDKKEKKNKLSRLSKIPLGNFISTLGDVANPAYMMAQVLALSLEENLHLHSSNIRRGNGWREEIRGDLPDYNDGDMIEYRLNTISNIFGIVANNGLYWSSLGAKKKQMLNYFHSWGETLNRLGLVEVGEETLETIAKNAA